MLIQIIGCWKNYWKTGMENFDSNCQNKRKSLDKHAFENQLRNKIAFAIAPQYCRNIFRNCDNNDNKDVKELPNFIDDSRRLFVPIISQYSSF